MKIGRKYIEDEYGVLYSEDGAVLLGYNREVFHCAEYRIKDGVKILAANAFHHCQSLKSISMPDSVTEVVSLKTVRILKRQEFQPISRTQMLQCFAAVHHYAT